MGLSEPRGTSIGRLLPLNDAPTLCGAGSAGARVCPPHCLSDVGRNPAPARPANNCHSWMEQICDSYVAERPNHAW